MREFRCKIARVVDGDTVDAVIDLGFKIMYAERIRLLGIDTPESRTANKREKVLGLASKDRLKGILSKARPGKNGAKWVTLETTKQGTGKYGRILGRLYVNGVDVNGLLVDENHARPYYGGSKDELGPCTREEGCTYLCGGRVLRRSRGKVRKCDGDWYRWTPGGYMSWV